jgi:predicted restriction endonuclease
MLTDINRKISIIAYYLSKFDMDAVRALGYENFSRAFEGTSSRFGKNNSYMKLRRDEFDVLTGSSRKGWHKRTPAAAVVLMHNDLKNYSFEEMTYIVKALLEDGDEIYVSPAITTEDRKIITEFSEEEIERIINQQDLTSKIVQKTKTANTRVFDNSIQKSLKKLYQYRCQICGATATVMYGVDVSEAHHIDFFTKSANNNPGNIIILCPDHHRIVHKAKAVFNFDMHQFEYENAKVDTLMYNLHL